MKSDTETHIKKANEDDFTLSSSFAILFKRIFIELEICK